MHKHTRITFLIKLFIYQWKSSQCSKISISFLSKNKNRISCCCTLRPLGYKTTKQTAKLLCSTSRPGRATHLTWSVASPPPLGIPYLPSLSLESEERRMRWGGGEEVPLVVGCSEEEEAVAWRNIHTNTHHFPSPSFLLSLKHRYTHRERGTRHSRRGI